MYGDVEPKTKGERDGAEQLITKLKLGYLERVSERGGSRRISSSAPFFGNIPAPRALSLEVRSVRGRSSSRSDKGVGRLGGPDSAFLGEIEREISESNPRWRSGMMMRAQCWCAEREERLRAEDEPREVERVLGEWRPSMSIPTQRKGEARSQRLMRRAVPGLVSNRLPECREPSQKSVLAKCRKGFGGLKFVGGFGRYTSRSTTGNAVKPSSPSPAQRSGGGMKGDEAGMAQGTRSSIVGLDLALRAPGHAPYGYAMHSNPARVAMSARGPRGTMYQPPVDPGRLASSSIESPVSATVDTVGVFVGSDDARANGGGDGKSSCAVHRICGVVGCARREARDEVALGRHRCCRVAFVAAVVLARRIVEVKVRIVHLKTASHMAKGCRASVILGGCAQGEVWKELAYAFGMNFGLVFQRARLLAPQRLYTDACHCSYCCDIVRANHTPTRGTSPSPDTHPPRVAGMASPQNKMAPAPFALPLAQTPIPSRAAAWTASARIHERWTKSAEGGSLSSPTHRRVSITSWMEHPNTHMYRDVVLFCDAPPHIGTRVTEKAGGVVCKEGHGGREGDVAGGGWEKSEDALALFGLRLELVARFDVPSAEAVVIPKRKWSGGGKY
ncbi:hypothetical protein B0H14DRAFT_3773243 [Mycena olivaceomarginata]|nr:hypothetical protein B0H14DRAFT_3773243 [Mycena olivaceomarginata]